MSVVALIGARAGSKGVKDKNIRPLGAHPLIAWTISVALRTPAIREVYVASDSPDYGHIASRYGAQFILLPKNVTGDDSPDIAWITHALTQLKTRPELVAHLRPTSPLRNFNVVNAAITRFIPWHDSLRSVEKMSESAFKTFTVWEGKLKTLNGQSPDEANAPRQGFADTWRPNGYIDVLKPAFILKNKALHGNNVQAYATQPITEVDSEEDFAYLEFQLRKRHHDAPVLARAKERVAG